MDNAMVLLPESLLVLLTVALFVMGRFAPRFAAPLATFGLVAILGALIGQAMTGAWGGPAFQQAVQIGPFAWLLRGSILLVAAASSALAWGEKPARAGLFFGLLTASTLGALGLVGSADLVMLFLSVNLMGIPLVGLLALSGGRASAEAPMKRFFSLGVTAAILLFSMSWLFGLGGSTSYAALGTALQTPDTLLTFGLLLLLGGLAFTLAAYPFHSWLPDIAEAGSPALASWLLGGAMLAALAGFVRAVLMIFPTQAGLWAPYVLGLAVLSLLGGSLLALAQSQLSRMVAYTAIATQGFALLALLAASHPASSHEGIGALLFTVLTAAIAAVGLFAGIHAAQANTLADLAGLHRRAPQLAMGLTACALGLAALPLAGAFWARVLLVRALLAYVSQSLQFALVGVAILAGLVGVISAYTALRIPRAIYLEASVAVDRPEIVIPTGHGVVLLLCALFSVGFFVAPASLWSLVTYATRGF